MSSTASQPTGARQVPVARDTPLTPDSWKTATVYQIYPRSFLDSNGDGIGDLTGMTSKVPYLAELGIDAVWLSPFYPSALADGGYDVDDYRNVAPNIGTMDEFDALVAALHSAGIGVIVDIVPNHSGSGHAWFVEALAAEPGSPARDRYVFRDGRGDAGELPPNDWPGHFGPSCWTRVPDGQWYMHLFAPEQPDFNWDNAEVREDFKTTLRFWADHGVDGFRVDAAHAVAKDLNAPPPPLFSLHMHELPEDGSHPVLDRDSVHEIYREWQKVFAEYDPPLVAVAEAVAPISRRGAYVESLGQVFSFELIEATWDPAWFRRSIEATMALSERSGGVPTWALTNHDCLRAASKYGLPQGADVNAWLMSGGIEPREDRVRGAARARAATLLMLSLPGTAYIYQGEELGLFEVADLPTDQLQDPLWKRSGHVIKGRDGCRVPLPWTSNGPTFGFTTGTPHLPMPEWFTTVSEEHEEADPASTLALHRSALAMRRDLQSGISIELAPDAADTVVHVVRDNGWHSVTNFGDETVELPRGELLLTSGPLAGGKLPPDTTAWVKAT